VENDSSIPSIPIACSISGRRIYGPADDNYGFEFSINPERVGPLLRRLVLPTNTRARIYGLRRLAHHRQPQPSADAATCWVSDLPSRARSRA